MVAAPDWVAVPIYAMFVLAGILLTVGTATDRWSAYVVGTVLGTVALLGVGAVAVVAAASPGVFLTLALAIILVVRLRRLRRGQIALSRVVSLDD